jgi:WASH complex subunit strumpellin
MGKKGGTKTFALGSGKPLDSQGMLRYAEQLKYLNILIDLDYVKDQDRYDQQFQASVQLIELDESFKETYLEIIERFYMLFESIYQYYVSVTTYLADVGEGKYIEFTVDAILQDNDGKTLIVETIYNYGVMLLLLDKMIPSIARERIISCYIRYMSGSASQLTGYVVALCK